MNCDEKVIKVLEYLQQFSAASQKTKLNIHDQRWSQYLDELPKYKNYVQICTDTNFTDNSIILKVKQPKSEEFEIKPSDEIEEWLDFDWENYRAKPKIKETIFFLGSEEKFYSDQRRVDDYNQWIEKREEWVKTVLLIKDIRRLFMKLYNIYQELESQSDLYELLIGDGFLRSSYDLNLDHPIFTKRVRLEYDADRTTMVVRDFGAEVQLYTLLLSEIGTNEANGSFLTSASGIFELSRHVEDEDLNILDPETMEDLLQQSIKLLNPDGAIVPYEEEISAENIKWEETPLVISGKPVLFERRKLEGAVHTFDELIKYVKETGDLPKPLLSIIGEHVETEPYIGKELSFEGKLAECSGEDPDIILPLQANKEQLEIARRIQTQNAVLVQGPPGTGKTHTIANLLSHFLATGKTVLVTSSTVKALSVLKNKMPEELQDLCVSLLREDNKDMDMAIKNIVERLSESPVKLEQECVALREERESVIAELADIRRQIYEIRSEGQLPIQLNGETYSVLDASKYVYEQRDTYETIIPGKVKVMDQIPLEKNELKELYGTNEKIDPDDEKLLEYVLTDVSGLPTPSNLEEFFRLRDHADFDYKEYLKDHGEVIQFDVGNVLLRDLTYEKIDRIRNEISNIYIKDVLKKEWIRTLIVEGKQQEQSGSVYDELCTMIEDTVHCAQEFKTEMLMNHIEIETNQLEELVSDLEVLKTTMENGGLSFLKKFKLKKSIKNVTVSVNVNGSGINVENLEQLNLVLHKLTIDKKRNEVCTLWDNLIGRTQDAPKSCELDQMEPEVAMAQYIPWIKKYFDWYNHEFMEFYDLLIDEGFEFYKLKDNSIVMDKDLIDWILEWFDTKATTVMDVCSLCLGNYEIDQKMEEVPDNTLFAVELVQSYKHKDIEEYEEIYNRLVELARIEPLMDRRNDLLDRVEEFAPGLSDAIRMRQGIHGEYKVPEMLDDAWKWKCLEQIVLDHNAHSLEKLQKKSALYSKRYRELTEKYAVAVSWNNVIIRNQQDASMKRNLTGWSQTVRAIGKGSGKNAPMLRIKARKLMKECQNAIPVWIMTTTQVYEHLNPGENKFDVVIVDEASQCNISSLALLGYAEKIVVVGDNKQVNPIAVGLKQDKINDLITTYMPKEMTLKHLFNGKASLYDMAEIAFEGTMLKEHFRCVPEIIGFSNILSYNHKIKPLRDGTKVDLKPAFLPIKINGVYDQQKKVNDSEVYATIGVVKALLGEMKYDNKSIGIISMLGEKQANEIRKLLFAEIDVQDIDKHKIDVGIASKFQGDERDVIILSLVSSNEYDKQGNVLPARLVADGSDEATKKRYNVAVSRAKDQVIIIHSLDRFAGLKEGDIRKRLLDYASRPQQYLKDDEIIAKSESPFEQAVATALVDQGYNIKQQVEVGSYRLDIVVFGIDNKIVIECDGEAYHSGAQKIQEDMERQTILERVGWKFIRIRGSEYYADPTAAMNSVYEQLKRHNIDRFSATQENEVKEDYTIDRIMYKTKEFMQNRISEFKNKEDTIIVQNYLACENEPIDELDQENDLDDSTDSQENEPIQKEDQTQELYEKDVQLDNAVENTNKNSYREEESISKEQIKQTDMKPNPVETEVVNNSKKEATDLYVAKTKIETTPNTRNSAPVKNEKAIVQKPQEIQPRIMYESKFEKEWSNTSKANTKLRHKTKRPTVTKSSIDVVNKVKKETQPKQKTDKQKYREKMFGKCYEKLVAYKFNVFRPVGRTADLWVEYNKFKKNDFIEITDKFRIEYELIDSECVFLDKSEKVWVVHYPVEKDRTNIVKQMSSVVDTNEERKTFIHNCIKYMSCNNISVSGVKKIDNGEFWAQCDFNKKEEWLERFKCWGCDVEELEFGNSIKWDQNIWLLKKSLNGSYENHEFNTSNPTVDEDRNQVEENDTDEIQIGDQGIKLKSLKDIPKYVSFEDDPRVEKDVAETNAYNVEREIETAELAIMCEGFAEFLNELRNKNVVWYLPDAEKSDLWIPHEESQQDALVRLFAKYNISYSYTDESIYFQENNKGCWKIINPLAVSYDAEKYNNILFGKVNTDHECGILIDCIAKYLRNKKLTVYRKQNLNNVLIIMYENKKKEVVEAVAKEFDCILLEREFQNKNCITDRVWILGKKMSY